MIDSEKKYIGWCINRSGLVSSLISRNSFKRLYDLVQKPIEAVDAAIEKGKKALERQPSRKKSIEWLVDRDNVASHVFLLHNNLIYESHFDTHGVHSEALSPWLKREGSKAEIYVTECDFDVKTAEAHVGKTGYSTRAILRAKFGIIAPLGHDGKMICSEYVAECTKAAGSIDFCKHYKYPDFCENAIIPLHIQLWALKNNKEIIKLNDASPR